jgi:3-phosphoshikimate 1-carboxyvinyltransferase
MHYTLDPGGSLSGQVRVPGDKSISHRSIMLGALADGTTRVSGFLEGEDALATLRAFRAMGVEIEGPDHGRVTVHGVGLDGLSAPAAPLDLGNAGTGMRLLCGLLAGQGFDTEVTGDESLCSRPMGRIIDPLARMGAAIESSAGSRPPLRILGGRRLQGIHYDLPMASAQVKSCVLLAGLYAAGRTSVTEPAPTRDHTERMLRGFGYPVQSDGGVIALEGGGRLRACDIDVPADISSAAFFIVAASIAPGSDILLQHVGVNPTRVGVLNILDMMGADIGLENTREVGGEPVADIRVRSAALRGIEIPVQQVPLAIDEFPALFIAAACAEGRTVLRGAEELRVKESDRIAAMAEGLTTLGIANEVLADGIIIDGGEMGGGAIKTHHDHRIAMSFAIAALRAGSPITVLDCDHVATSFPGFAGLARNLGLRIEAGEVPGG